MVFSGCPVSPGSCLVFWVNSRHPFHGVFGPGTAASFLGPRPLGPFMVFSVMPPWPARSRKVAWFFGPRTPGFFDGFFGGPFWGWGLPEKLPTFRTPFPVFSTVPPFLAARPLGPFMVFLASRTGPRISQILPTFGLIWLGCARVRAEFLPTSWGAWTANLEYLTNRVDWSEMALSVRGKSREVRSRYRHGCIAGT